MPLKNQALPPDTGEGVLKESGPAKTGHVDPAKPSNFSQFGVFFRRVPLKNKVIPPDTMGFDGFSKDN